MRTQWLFAAVGIVPTGLLAATFNNAAGTGLWSDTGNWVGGTLPTNVSGNGATINGFTTAVNNDFGAVYTVSGGSAIVNGTTFPQTVLEVQTGGNLTVGAGHININGHSNTGTKGLDVIVSGGSLTFDRMFTNPSATSQSSGRLSITGGSLTVTNRVSLNNHLFATAVQKNGFSISGGSIDLTAAANGFTLYGYDDDDRAYFNVIGNAGTFIGNRSVVLYRNDLATSATDVSFKFGTAAGAGALTVINSSTLTLGGNELTIDFSDILRPTETTNYSTVLFDYSSTLTVSGVASTDGAGAFTPNWVGLGDGESASLVFDGTNRLFRVDYTLAPVPEPAMAGIAAIAGLAMLSRRRRV